MLLLYHHVLVGQRIVGLHLWVRLLPILIPEGLDEIPGAELFSVEPYVTSIKVQDFLVAVAEKTSQNTIEIYRLRNRLSNWRAIAGITSFVLLLILIYLISP